jgi:hypothetical protein
MARWHSCNVLQDGAEIRHVWQFDAGNGSFALRREQKLQIGEPLPFAWVGKSWSCLWQPKLNVAWLPPEDVFVRVAQFPQSTPEETRAMVELQLEKLSPIPVTQAVWTMHCLPQPAGRQQAAPPPGAKPGEPATAAAAPMQTVVLTVVARSVVEEFLGRLETEGYLADRLEVPVLDQLQATRIQEDGAWIYPLPGGKTALVAWWYGGVLHNLDWLASHPGEGREAALKDQLIQMAWAGELEGWLTSPPTWHLVGDPVTAQDWEPVLRRGIEQPVEVLAPLSSVELAGLTARRAAQADPGIQLLPQEFAKRYRQKFVDRLWLRGLGAALGLYAVGCIIYFIAVGVLSFKTSRVEQQVADLGQSFTNALQIKARYAVLKDRQELKFAALDCWEATAELIPEGLTLDSLNFSDGQKMSLSGTAPSAQVTSVIDFSGKLRKAMARGQPLFDAGAGDPLHTQMNPGGMVSWSCGVQLKRTEEQ